MRRHAKASSAFTFGRTGVVAPALIALALTALLALALAPAASATKYVDSFFGNPTESPGTTGGLFGEELGGVAVNDSSGAVYVVDRENNRIQQFDAANAFVRAWGADVIETGAPNDVDTRSLEICDTTAGNTAADCKQGTTAGAAAGGEFNSAQGVAVNQATGHVYVTDGGYLRVQEFDASGNFVRAWGRDVIASGQPNDSGEGFEVCTVAAECKAGISGTGGGAFGSTFDGYPSVVPAGAPNAGNVLVPDPANQRVQEFTANGAFVRAFGSDVVQPGGTGEAVGPSLNEIQKVTLPPIFGFDPIAGGTFKLTFEGQTTAPIKWNASGIEVETALVALSNVGPGDVSASGPVKGPWDVEFSGAFALTNVSQMIGDGSQLTSEFFTTPGSGEANVSTSREGGPSPALEICSVATQCKVGVAGNSVGQFGANQPKRAVADSTGAVYTNELTPNSRVQKFSGPSLAPSLFANDVLGVADSSESAPTEIAYDSAADRVLFVVQRTPPTSVCPSGLPEAWILEFTTSGTLEDTDDKCTGILRARGLAVRPSNGRLYLPAQFRLISDNSSDGSRRVWVLDDDGFGPAISNLNPPTEITEHSVRISGTITPNGPVGVHTRYRFQYSRDGVAWTDASAEADIGDGSGPVAVGPLTINELEAGALYHLRLITAKGFGNPEATSPELTFSTDAAAPEVQTRYPQSHTDTTARLAADLNPNNLPTTYRFEYGKTTAYGSLAPVPDGSASGGTTQFFTTDVKGLEAGTTYHYRIVATNSEGTTNGNDVVFETYAAGASTKPQRAYEMMTPPFKTVRSPTSFGGAVGNNPNPGIPSLDGNSMLWSTTIFPLTEDVTAAAGGDRRLLTRTPEGWTFKTLNTASPKVQVAGEVIPGAGTSFAKEWWNAASGDQKTLTLVTQNHTLLPSEGYEGNAGYIHREGTGLEGGFTPWVTNTDTQGNPTEQEDSAVLNDDGTVLLRWGPYAGLAENPNTPRDDDPSDEQVRNGSVYLVRSADPDGLPSAPKVLVNECTGTGASATEIPDRVGTGSAATDTIGTRACEEAPNAPAATGTGMRSTGSATLTDVTTASGAFDVGQVVSGIGILRGTTITAIGAGTLTISNPVQCGGAQGESAAITTGSPLITEVKPVCGAFEAGQPITGPGIPGGATIVSVDGKYALTISANATASTLNGDLVAETTTATTLTANSQHVTSTGRAVGGSSDGAVSIGTVSNDGNRVFFTSFSTEESGGGSSQTCADGSGADTSCPPQLFVRQYDSEGNPTVRWISRAQGVGPQQIGEIGSAVFQGASRDGRYVYFQTNAPLLPTDPNAGSSITTGTAQDDSWDLYRYTLPESRDEDPANGTLLRVTGGPSGTADPSTNGIISNGTARTGSLRYFSDDGRRAYFVTTAEIPGAINNPPNGGSTVPGGTVGNAATRNLYLFDDTGAAPEWRFIARLPFSTVGQAETDPASLNSCASGYSGVGGFPNAGLAEQRGFQGGNCFRGTPDGSGVIFFTRGQLTADDRDDAGDIYFYNAETDELTRVSAPQNESEPYLCNRDVSGHSGGLCNADIGMNLTGPGFASLIGGLERSRGWGGGRQYNIGQDADGTIRIFFESESELVPADTNGVHMDVYEWSSGRLSLVSPGDTPDQSFYSGNGLNGRDAFIFTSARIDPREIDDNDYDLYDVRVGGGFPYTPPPTPCDVLAHQCRPDASPPAAPRTATSGSFSGAGNPKSTKKKAKCAKNKVRRKGKCVRKQSKGNGKSKSKKRAAKQTGRASR